MKKWQAHKTLLIVGEGYDEVAFLNHLKQFPGVCGRGVEITIRNARGKGAAGVIDCAIKLKANAAFDKRRPFCGYRYGLDTPAVAKTRQAQWHTSIDLASLPLEALLLQVALAKRPARPRI